MKIGNKIFTVVLLCIFVCRTPLINAQDNYPVPVKTIKMLFYLQRSHNKNTIIYELNTLPDGKVNIQKPINIYWIRYEEGGRKAELSFLQNKAFGVRCRVSDKEKASFIIHFNSFDKREIVLSRTFKGDYKAYLSINNEMAELVSSFIKSENSSFGFPLSFKFIEFHGISVISGRTISEKIIL